HRAGAIRNQGLRSPRSNSGSVAEGGEKTTGRDRRLSRRPCRKAEGLRKCRTALARVFGAETFNRGRRGDLRQAGKPLRGSIALGGLRDLRCKGDRRGGFRIASRRSCLRV